MRLPELLVDAVATARRDARLPARSSIRRTDATPATVSFIVPVRNDAERLEVCLRSMRTNAVGAAIELIVVDNGSVDRSAEVARKAGAKVIRIEGFGVAHLRNVGAAKASGEILAFVDADHEIASTWVAERGRARWRSDGVAAAGALCHPPREGTWVQQAYGALRGTSGGQRDVEWLGSGNHGGASRRLRGVRRLRHLARHVRGRRSLPPHPGQRRCASSATSG